MYFKNFPKFLYDFKYGTTNDTKMSIVMDITRNVRFRKEVLENFTLYDEYDLKDNETAEMVAERVYGNPNYHWIIMLVNQKYDYLSDFPIDYNSLKNNTAKKYNPNLHSQDGYWRISGGKLYAIFDNIEDSADLPYLINPVPFTITGETSNGTFTISNIFGADATTGLNVDTQEFWVNTTVTGTPVGKLTVTTTQREYEPLYYINADGFQVSDDQPGATPVSGAQYEEMLNESKRKIKLISPDAISLILKQYKELM